MRIKEFLLNGEYIERDSYIWNMSGSILMAFQSVIMLMVLTRVLGLKAAGIFTIACADANLFLTIGKYGMRNYQVSDVREQFSFGEYWVSRVITSVAMAVVSFGYVLYAWYMNGYTIEKSLVIAWMCIFKVIDAVEDIYHGHYQRENRLDVAGKALTLRMILTICSFGFCLVMLRNLLISLIITTVISGLLFTLFTVCASEMFPLEKEKTDRGKIRSLLKGCTPLFISSFFAFYIGNAPKYAIDAALTDELQACYGFIAMPVFVIGLLNGFIFNPMLHKMSILWNEGKTKEFVRRILCQIGIITLITAVCMTGAYFAGIPVLSWIYNTNLSPYKSELLILLLGGGFLGLAGFLNIINTIIRKQKSLMWGYTAIALAAYLFSENVVAKYEMFGAAMLYMALMSILCLVFAGILVIGIKRRRGLEEK